MIYLVQRSSISKNKVYRAFDIAVLEVVSAVVIIQSILESEELTIVKGSHVCADAKCHSLFTNRAGRWCRRRVLQRFQRRRFQSNHSILLGIHFSGL